MMSVQNNHKRNDLCVETVRDLADFMKVVAILITGILPLGMVDGFVCIAPPDEAGGDGVFIGVDERSRLHIALNEWLNGWLLDIG